MSQPHIVIIPAASAPRIIYEKVIQGMIGHGYEIDFLHIPSVGLEDGAREGSPPTMYDDVEFIAPHITALADAGKHVLLVAHSYGGTPASQVVKGLGIRERQKQGKQGGIVGLAYMTCLVPELGKPASSMVGQAPEGEKPLMALGDDGWFYYPDVSAVATKSVSGLPYEEALYWAKKLVKHSAASFASPLTYAGYKDVPVSYLVCENDNSIVVGTQRAQIEMIERESGNKVDVTTISAGHAPTQSDPQVVIDWVLRAARKLEEHV